MKEQAWHRRHAIALQLNEAAEDALLIIAAAERIVRGFLADPEPSRKPAPAVVRIGGNECA